MLFSHMEPLIVKNVTDGYIFCFRQSLLGSLSSDVFERRTSTGSGRFALLSRDFEQIFGQIVSIRIKTLGIINMVASRLTKREKGSLPVDVRRSKTSLLKLPITVTNNRPWKKEAIKTGSKSTSYCPQTWYFEPIEENLTCFLSDPLSSFRLW